MQRQTPEKTIEAPQAQYMDETRDRIPQRIAEQAVDAAVPQVAEEIIEMSDAFSQDRIQQRNVEQITEASAVSFAEEIVEVLKAKTQEEIICCLKEATPEFLEELLEVIQLRRQERTQEHTVEETEFPVPHVMEKTSEAVKLIPQERVQNCAVRQIIDMPVVFPSSEQCTRSFADTWVRQVSIPETHVGSCSVSNVTHSLTGGGPVSRPSVEEAIHSTPFSPKRRLSQTEFDHVVQEGERCQDDDETNKARIEVKNGLENCCVTVRNAAIEEQCGFKCEAGGKEKPESCAECRELVGQE